MHDNFYPPRSYGIALFGFYCQLMWGFGLPFPLNIVMWPFSLVEWYIRWSITSLP